MYQYAHDTFTKYTFQMCLCICLSLVLGERTVEDIKNIHLIWNTSLHHMWYKACIQLQLYEYSDLVHIIVTITSKQNHSMQVNSNKLQKLKIHAYIYDIIYHRN